MQVSLPQKSHVPHHGFTLVETLVAISVLLTVIIGPMTIASRGMQSAFYAGDQTVAIYLAQEAIEYIQGLRDNDALVEFREYSGNGSSDNDTLSWYTNLPNACKTAPGCDIDLSNSTYRNCATTGNCLLNTYTGTAAINRIYGYTATTGWVPSVYTRQILLGAVNNGGIPVTVTVSWYSGLFRGTRSVVLQTYVYDSYQRYE